MNDEDEEYELNEDRNSLKWKLLHLREAMSETPCIKKSFMTGISSGIIVGIAYFLFTSKSKRAVNLGFGSYLTLTTATWLACQYKRGLMEGHQQKVLKGLQQSILLEGTEQGLRLEEVKNER